MYTGFIISAVVLLYAFMLRSAYVKWKKGTKLKNDNECLKKELKEYDNDKSK